MKKFLILIVSTCFLFGSCSQDKKINSTVYKSIGIVDIIMKDNKNISDYDSHIKYEVCWSNVILGAIFIETIIAPIYFYGFSMFNPVDTLSKPSKGE